MKKLIKLFVFVIPISFLVASCYPGFDATIEEMDIAVTKYDSTQNFTQLSSFFLYDTIVYIDDDEDSEDIDHTQEDHILSEVRQNLLNLGWTEKTEADTTADGEIDADVSIMVSALATDISYYYYYWWDYWYWYPWDYWYPWYPGYPIYPVYPVYPSYGYTVGSVLIDMVNMNDAEMPHNPDRPSGKIPVIWTGGVNGILSGSDSNIASRLTKQIGQVFKQSPYLNKKDTKNE